MTVDELERHEALNQRAIDRARMRPVEAVERLAGAEAGRAGAAREVDGVASPLFEFGELLEANREHIHLRPSEPYRQRVEERLYPPVAPSR